MKQASTRVEDGTYRQVEKFAMQLRSADPSRSYSISDALRDLIERGLASVAAERNESGSESGHAIRRSVEKDDPKAVFRRE